MKYVIKYEDGAYNLGRGHPVTLSEAEVYNSYDEAVEANEELCDGKVEPYTSPPDKIDTATESLWLMFTSYYDLRIGAKPTKEEVKRILSQTFEK